MVDRLKIVYKQVGKSPIVMEIEDTLEVMQNLVGGCIEVLYYKDDLLLVCNEDAKSIGNLKYNLRFDYDSIIGDCFIVGEDCENFKSIEDNQIEDIIKELNDRSIIPEELERNELNKWFNAFFKKKEIDLNDVFIIEEKFCMKYGHIIETIKAATDEQKLEIKNMLIKIEQCNRDIEDYLKYLGKGILIDFKENEMKEYEATTESEEEHE